MTVPSMHKRSRIPAILLTVVLCGLIASGLAPNDRLTWVLEIFPILLALPVLIATARSNPLTPLLYWLLAVHAAILSTGGHYTYADVPLGFWMQDRLGFARNHFDRIGHFVQGFVPAILMRELLLTKTSLRHPGWIFWLVCAMCLACSALYELFEWAAAVTLGQSATAFLGTQGDEWDTQWDMFLALVGAIMAQLLLASLHDRQLTQLIPRSSAEPHSGTPFPPFIRGVR